MIKESWFDSLTMVGLREHHSWLANLPFRVDRIANFGCMSGSEPFALLWILDAREVTVVEIDKKFLGEGREQYEIVGRCCPESLQDRVVNFVCGDITKPLAELPDQYFDLAYCENVLYTLPYMGGSDALERGISQMIRVIKPSGLIIAVEPKFGAKFKMRGSKVLGVDISMPIQISKPIDMSNIFSLYGLTKLEIPGSPLYTYCYQKNSE